MLSPPTWMWKDSGSRWPKRCRAIRLSVDGSGERVILSGKVNSDALADSAVKLAGLYRRMLRMR